jgi:hypothetical protein
MDPDGNRRRRGRGVQEQLVLLYCTSPLLMLANKQASKREKERNLSINRKLLVINIFFF